MGLEKFDNIIDTVQRAATIHINDKQLAAFKKKYSFEPVFEYGRDETGRYVIRTTKEMLEEMEFYLALKYERDLIDLYMNAEVDGKFYVSVSYGEDALHLQELFQFLEENK
ncbi:hypothetical protein BACCIP111899_00117 [Bacillus rhizoplanae]|uniref:DUF3909 domain-containing protein n=1 Tax=Bacillus rhizoplanae TaxID=2880966 RepID=A0ABN7ZQQ7_9BACI|nr:DUF3909 family protein [Bacillus rhizoplanae]CAG9610945.1 hypothetical protein BACCIP111899_00117 [Bacillus rhizoplanae]